MNAFESEESVLQSPSEEALLHDLREQIEFYFSDENVLFDGFLLKKIFVHKRQFVKLKNFLKFSKIKELFRKNSLAAPESRSQVLASALRGSKKLVLNRLENMV